MLHLIYHRISILIPKIKGANQMGLLDILDYGLIIGHTAREISDITKVNSSNFQQNNLCNIYFFHSKSHLSLLYAEAGGAGGYCCFGVWCRMNGYWNAAYRYLKVAAHDSTHRSRAEFSRVCFVLGKYEDAITFGNRYQYTENWQPSLYMALSYFMLGDTEKCKEMLLIVSESQLQYGDEAALARGFLQSEYGMKFEVPEKPTGFFAKLLSNFDPKYIIPMDKNTALEIASAKEDTVIYDAGGYKAFNLGGALIPVHEKPPKDGITYHYLVSVDKWARTLPKCMKESREEMRQRLEPLIPADGVARTEFIEDCRYLHNFEYDPQTGKLLDAPTRYVPYPFDIDKIKELIDLDL